MAVEVLGPALAVQGLPATDKLVLIGLANHAKADGTVAYPAVQTLAVYCCASERTVQRALRRLEDEGLISRSDWQPDHIRSDRRPVAYDLNLDVLRGDILSPRERQDTPRGDTQGRHGVTPRASRGDIALSPEPSLEPSVEPLKENTRPQRNRKRKPEVPLPEGWQPTSAHHDLAASLGVDCLHEAAKFADHAAAKDRRMRDWDAAFRTWLRQARDFGIAAKQPAGGSGGNWR